MNGERTVIATEILPEVQSKEIQIKHMKMTMNTQINVDFCSR